MASAAKVAGITVLALLVVGLVVGSLTWAILASQGPAAPDPPELLELEWWQDVVLYQIYPRSFKDSDGDGIGDLKGITSQLEHFVDCGVGAIWLSPIFKSPMVDFGYDVSDFYAIQDEYGTMADFEEMVQKAHSLGIKVLLDYVPNHSSDKAEYFMKSVRRQDGYDNWYVWADPIPDPNDPTKTTVPSNWISQFGGSVWRWNNIRQQYYLHQFAAEQPDFNFREPAVRQEMRNIMAFWFEKGVDGFRMDAVPHMFETAPDENGRYPDEPLTHNPFLRPDQPGYTTQIHVRDLPELYDVIYEWRDFTTEWQRKHGGEPKILLAEAYANVPKTMLYYGDEKGRLGANFPFNFDFITELSGHSNARDFAYIIQRWMTYMPRGMTANWVFGNHDQPRMPSRFRDIMVDGLNSLNILLPGVSITYQGEEIGMRDGFVSWEDTKDVNALNQGNEDNYLEFSRDPCRTPYHWDSTTSAGFSTNPKTWLPVAQDYTEINLKKQKDDARSHFKVYQALTKLKKEPSLTHGDYRVYPLTANTLVFVRSLVTYDTYALVFNVGTESDTVDLSTVPHLAEPMEVYISSTHSTRVAGDEIGFGTITLRPGEALVLKAPPT